LLLNQDEAAGDDGFLMIGEVLPLDLDCEQVVLATCSSALGKEITGEGLIGLTQAFLYAGARCVVATLWEVSGKPTSLFMREFYGDLVNTHTRDRNHALCEAKRVLIRDEGKLWEEGVPLSHPFFWAGFVMIGEGS